MDVAGAVDVAGTVEVAGTVDVAGAVVFYARPWCGPPVTAFTA